MTSRWTDIHGNCAVSSVSDSVILYPAFPVKLSKIQYLTGKNEYKRQLQTVHITADQLADENGFDKEQIKSIRFVFDRLENGKVHIIVERMLQRGIYAIFDTGGPRCVGGIFTACTHQSGTSDQD